MSKEAMRAEADRLIKEAMEKKAITIKQGDTRIEATCGRVRETRRSQNGTALEPASSRSVLDNGVWPRI